jgi:hypothetical protein
MSEMMIPLSKSLEPILTLLNSESFIQLASDFKQLFMAIVQSQQILADYLPPDSELTAEVALNKLLTILDDESLAILMNKYESPQESEKT